MLGACTAVPKTRKGKDESINATCALSVVLYGPRNAADDVGAWLDSLELYLRTPAHCSRDVPYCNPHRMTDPDARVIMTCQVSGILEQTTLDSDDPL